MSQKVGGFPGILLGIEQRLGGVVPARQDPVYARPILSGQDKGFVYSPSSSATRTGIVPMIPDKESRDNAELFILRAMGDTQSDNPDVPREYLNKLLGELTADPKNYRFKP